jgi:hypothetical protein
MLKTISIEKQDGWNDPDNQVKKSEDLFFVNGDVYTLSIEDTVINNLTEKDLIELSDSIARHQDFGWVYPQQHRRNIRWITRGNSSQLITGHKSYPATFDNPALYIDK